ncbi:MAG: hypothetical protein ACREL7_12000 [Longimicrobiales bacterium]
MNLGNNRISSIAAPSWSRSVTLAVLASAVGVPVSGAQLRPVDPIDWTVFDTTRTLAAELGVGVLTGQRASLAGTRGDLLEAGNFRLAWRSGRIGLELTGTLLRRFSDETVVDEPFVGADPPTGEPRRDAGDIRAATLLRLTPATMPVLLALRFGTRLPTTSEQVGLDRDRTDFFATLGARWSTGALAVGGESGIAINGTRVTGLDQLDVWTYSLGIEYRLGMLTSHGTIVGQNDVHRRVVRGNEDLAELRVGLRAGDRIWVGASFVYGLADYSPGRGMLIMAGIRR